MSWSPTERGAVSRRATSAAGPRRVSVEVWDRLKAQTAAQLSRRRLAEEGAESAG